MFTREPIDMLRIYCSKSASLLLIWHASELYSDITWVSWYLKSLSTWSLMTLTLNFQGQTWNLLYLSQKWSDCHETKSKHIDWTQGLKCDHGVWPGPWPWSWIFNVKYGVCYISIKSDPKVRCKDLQDSDQGDFWCRRAVDSSSLFNILFKILSKKTSKLCHLIPSQRTSNVENVSMSWYNYEFWSNSHPPYLAISEFLRYKNPQ